MKFLTPIDRQNGHFGDAFQLLQLLEGSEFQAFHQKYGKFRLASSLQNDSKNSKKKFESIKVLK